MLSSFFSVAEILIKLNIHLTSGKKFMVGGLRIQLQQQTEWARLHQNKKVRVFEEV